MASDMEETLKSPEVSGISVIDIESEGVVTDTIEELLPRLNLPKDFVKTSARYLAINYNTSHQRRGHCIVFNHHVFDKSTRLSDRNGTNTDRDSIVSLFTTLGFEVTTFNNLNVKEIFNHLEHYSREVDHTENACFIVVFMSYGDDGHLYGRNAMFKAESLLSPFSDDNCPSLAGKPKIFLIQASCGDGVDNDFTPCQSDVICGLSHFLISWSTVPDHICRRNPTDGSLFIQAVVKIFSSQADKNDVLAMMTNVNRHMFESNCPSIPGTHMEKQVACSVSTLMHKIYLFPLAQQYFQRPVKIRQDQ